MSNSVRLFGWASQFHNVCHLTAFHRNVSSVQQVERTVRRLTTDTLANATASQISRSRPYPLPSLHSTRSKSDGSYIGSSSMRTLWTRGLRKNQEIEQLVSDESTCKKLDPPRFSFYSTSSTKFTYAATLTDLGTEESALNSMLDADINHEFHQSSEVKPASEASEAHSYWLDVLKATPEEILQLCTKLGVHSLTIEDIMSGEVNEKVEIHPNYRFISYRSFNPDATSTGYLDNVNVYILVFPHATLSLRSGAFPNSSRIAKRLEERFKHAESKSTQWILFEIIDAITDGFTLALKPVQAKVEELSESFLGKSKDSAAILHTIASTRKKVLALRRLLGNKSEVLKSLVKRFSTDTKSEIGLHFSDVEDHINAITQDLNHWEETLSQSENNCLIQLNLQTSLAQNESSDAISKLTILSTVILPLNVITGLWGMNVPVPGQGSDSLYWFTGLASAMVVVATSGYLWATRFMRQHRKSAKDNH